MRRVIADSPPFDMYREGMMVPSGSKTRTAGGIEYELTRRKGMKRIKIVVKPPDGRVCVSASPIERTAAIDDFVASQTEWIATTRARMSSLPKLMPVEYSDGEQVCLWGEPSTIRLRIASSNRVKVTLDGGDIVMSAPTNAEIEELAAAYERFLSREVADALNDGLLHACEERTGLSCTGCTVRRMTSRWGSCTYSTGKIRISNRLALYPRECLEMVVIHELGHLVHRGHGPEFKDYMDEFCPGWRRIRMTAT